MSQTEVNAENLSSFDKPYLAQTLLNLAAKDPVEKLSLRYALILENKPESLSGQIRKRCQPWTKYKSARLSNKKAEQITSEIEIHMDLINELLPEEPYSAFTVMMDLLTMCSRVVWRMSDQAGDRYRERYSFKASSLMDKLTELCTHHSFDPDEFVDGYLSLYQFGWKEAENFVNASDNFLGGPEIKALLTRAKELVTLKKASRLTAHHRELLERYKDNLSEANALKNLEILVTELSACCGDVGDKLKEFLEKHGDPDGYIYAVNDFANYRYFLAARNCYPPKHPLLSEMRSPAVTTYIKYLNVLSKLGSYLDALQLYGQLFLDHPTARLASKYGWFLRNGLSKPEIETTCRGVIDSLKNQFLDDAIRLGACLSMWSVLRDQMGGDDYFNQLIMVRRGCVAATDLRVWHKILLNIKDGDDDENEYVGSIENKDSESRYVMYHSRICLGSWVIIHREIFMGVLRTWKKKAHLWPRGCDQYALSRYFDATEVYLEWSQEQPDLALHESGLPSHKAWKSTLDSQFPDVMKCLDVEGYHENIQMTKVAIKGGVGKSYIKL